MKEDTQKEKREYLDVYTIVRNKNKNLKDLFVRCGAGYPNKDGSLNIVLSSPPVNDELHVRSPKKSGPCWKAKPGARYPVLEPPQGKTDKQWKRLGVAFGNNDGSLNIRLNLYPDPNRRRLHIREPQNQE